MSTIVSPSQSAHQHRVEQARAFSSVLHQLHPRQDLCGSGLYEYQHLLLAVLIVPKHDKVREENLLLMQNFQSILHHPDFHRTRLHLKRWILLQEVFAIIKLLLLLKYCHIISLWRFWSLVPTYPDFIYAMETFCCVTARAQCCKLRIHPRSSLLCAPRLIHGDPGRYRHIATFGR